MRSSDNSRFGAIGSGELRSDSKEVWGPPNEWDKHNPPSVDDLPDDLARLALLEQTPVTVLTLDHAEIVSGRGWEEIGLIRIVVA